MSDKFNEYIWQIYFKKFRENHDLFATFDKDWQEKIYLLTDKYASAKEMYYFARDVKNASISRIENAIIKTNNAEYIYRFAFCVKDANIQKLEDAIIKTIMHIIFIVLLRMLKVPTKKNLYKNIMN